MSHQKVAVHPAADEHRGAPVQNPDLLDHLQREYGDRVPANVITEALYRAEAKTRGARITTFVPILVHRHAREAIRAYEHGASC